VKTTPERDRRPSQRGDLYPLRSLIANVYIFLELPEDPYKSELSAIDKLAPSCPFKLLHTFSLLPASEALLPLLDTAPLIRVPEGLQPF
jgi:hypothetical protein